MQLCFGFILIWVITMLFCSSFVWIFSVKIGILFSCLLIFIAVADFLVNILWHMLCVVSDNLTLHSLILLQVVHDDGAVSYLKVQFWYDWYGNCFFVICLGGGEGVEIGVRNLSGLFGRRELKRESVSPRLLHSIYFLP